MLVLTNKDVEMSSALASPAANLSRVELIHSYSSTELLAFGRELS
jgi:hypothetical protein